MTSFLSVLLVVVGILNIVIGITIFRRTTPTLARWPFLALLLATGWWAISIAFFTVARSVEWAQLFVDSYYIAAIAIGSGLTAFSLSISKQLRYRPLLLFLSYIPTIILLIITLSTRGWIVEVNTVTGSLTSRVTLNELHYSLYGVAFLLMFGIGTAIFWRAMRQARGKVLHRNQVIMAGITFAGFIGILFNLILPWLGIYDYIAVGPLFSIFFALSVTYAIVRYSFFDLRQTIVMSISYVLASLVAIAVYLGVIWIFGIVFVSATSNQYLIGTVYLAIALIIATTFNIFRRIFDQLTARLFLREQRNVEVVIDEFGDAILGDTDSQSIVEKAEGVISETVHPTQVGFVLVRDNDVRTIAFPDTKSKKLTAVIPLLDVVTEDMQTIVTDTARVGHRREIDRLLHQDIAIVIRMQLKDRLIGYLVIGSKKNGGVYTSSEAHMLNAMADELALAIDSSYRFQEIQQFNSRLKREVNKATRDLRVSNQQLRDLDATKDEFVSMASHQLRTPLTSVKGYISMVLEGDAGKITDEQRQLLGEAFASSERMVHLIGDFLNVSRIQTGKFMIDRQQCDIAKLVEQEVEGMLPMAENHALTIEYRHAGLIPMLYLDEGKIRQVVMNFIDNAVYYSPEGGKILVRLFVEDGDVVCTIKDKGIGVPKDVQHKLFTKFFRAGNAQLQRPDGTGIGLYLAKKVIDGHGGRILVESQEGKGSTFGFRLPIRRLAKPPETTV